MTENITRGKLKNLIKPHLQELYFPDGIYGGAVYYLEEDGFYGPHQIPDYVVPICFSSEALSKFYQKLTSCNKDVNSISDTEIACLTQGIDLTFGEGWDLAPEDFIEMVKSGCKADTYYLNDSSIGIDDYVDFFSFLEEGLFELYPLKKWCDLNLEDIEYWFEILSEESET
jgi:hypothetical protein